MSFSKIEQTTKDVPMMTELVGTREPSDENFTVIFLPILLVKVILCFTPPTAMTCVMHSLLWTAFHAVEVRCLKDHSLYC